MNKVLIIALFLSLSACDLGGPKSPRGFVLPEGDLAQGKKTFIELECHGCHKVAGIEQPQGEGQPQFSIKLGGQSTQITTYGQLLASIVNPSHRLVKGYPASLVSEEGVSKMRNYNSVMTVEELVNLVAFLQPQYRVISARPIGYYPNYLP